MNFAEQQAVKAISLGVTENCPLRCEYCFCGEKTSRDMDLKVAKDTLDWFVSPEVSGDIKQLTVDLWGGEPLMRWSFNKEVMAYGNFVAQKNNKKILWDTTTNGIYLTKEVCTDINLLGMSFMISIDGNKSTMDYYRPLANGKSSYDAIIKNLINVKESFDDKNIRARATIREDNVHNLFENIKHIHEELGINQISFSLAHESPWLPDSINELDKQLGLIADWYLQEKRSGKEVLWIKFIEDIVGKILYPRPMEFFCGAGRTYLGVSVDGKIFPCHRFIPFGDKRPSNEIPFCLGSVYEGLTDPKTRSIFLQPTSSKKVCTDCHLYKQNLCSGSCYAVNVEKSGGDVSVPALSGCKEAELAIKHTLRIYNELITLPAYKHNLRFLAKSFFNPKSCTECTISPNEVAIIENARDNIQSKVNILNSALGALGEINEALQMVIKDHISEEQIKLSLLKED